MDEIIFKQELNKKTALAEVVISRHIPEKEGDNGKAIEAMDYSVKAGGKRLRPVFMMESFRLFKPFTAESAEDVPAELAAFMAAIEYIHTYSLVHDDLPAMDNDELRRGRATTWKVYGDGMGVLAGDGLLNYAYELAIKTAMKYAEQGDTATCEACIRAAKILSEKAGIYGMIGGQCADLEAEGKEKTASEEELLYIHEHKTGCLIEAALMTGGALAGASAEEIGTLEKIGSDIGIAFQIRDDILDIIGDTAQLGKKTGSDEANDKVTYVTLNGLEESEKEVKRLSDEAKKLLEKLPGDKEFLTSLTDSLIGRTN